MQIKKLTATILFPLPLSQIVILIIQVLIFVKRGPQHISGQQLPETDSQSDRQTDGYAVSLPTDRDSTCIHLIPSLINVEY
jgi:hypothetical protein